MDPLIPRRASLVLVACVLLLLATGVSAIAMDLNGSGGLVGKQIVDLFHLDGEHTVPAWFTSMLLLACAALAWLLSRSRHPHALRHRWLWVALALGFTALSMDEASAIHERTGRLAVMVAGEGGLGGAFTFAWVAVALPVVTAVGILYWRFLRDLPARHRRRLLIAAACYLGGAIGMEMINGSVWSTFGAGAFYWALVVVEEGAEMLGAILAVRAFSLMLEEAAPATAVPPTLQTA